MLSSSRGLAVGKGIMQASMLYMVLRLDLLERVTFKKLLKVKVHKSR